MFMESVRILYVTLNAYLIWRMFRALRGTGFRKWLVLAVYLPFSYCFFLQHRVERQEPSAFTETIIRLGSLYAGVLIYLVFYTLLADIVRLLDRLVPVLPKPLRRDRRKAGRTAFFAVVGLTAATVTGGFFYARHVRVKTMDISIAKKAGPLENLKAVFLADLHVGPFLRTSRLEKIVDKINAQDPDVVLIAGDVYDEGMLPAELERLPGVLAKIRARDGVFASPGNHEFFAGIRQSTALFEKAGITFLRDKAVLVADAYTVAGRSTRSYLGPDRRRVPLAKILEGVDPSLPVILLEHVPVHLEEAAAAGIDLQLSGHTHAGGVFPATLINRFLYDIAYGYGRRRNTQIYVTSGVGVWAPPIRIGTTGEIVRMDIRFLPR
jgi:hypothetical protein